MPDNAKTKLPLDQLVAFTPKLPICNEADYSKPGGEKLSHTELMNWYVCLLKFMFSKKAIKIDEIFAVDLTLTT